MNFFKGIFNWFMKLFSSEEVQSLIRSVIVQVIREEYGMATPQNRAEVYNKALDRLEKKGFNVKQNKRLIAAILNEEFNAQIRIAQNEKGRASFVLIIAMAALAILVASPAMAVDVTLSWTAPADDRVTGYDVYWGSSNPPDANTQTVQGRTTTETVIPDLTEGNVVYFGAKSHDADGNQSVMSDVIEWTVVPGPQTITVPGKPGEIRLIFE